VRSVYENRREEKFEDRDLCSNLFYRLKHLPFKVMVVNTGGIELA
jgi:hypothetical protein